MSCYTTIKDLTKHTAEKMPFLTELWIRYTNFIFSVQQRKIMYFHRSILVILWQSKDSKTAPTVGKDYWPSSVTCNLCRRASWDITLGC